MVGAVVCARLIESSLSAYRRHCCWHAQVAALRGTVARAIAPKAHVRPGRLGQAPKMARIERAGIGRRDPSCYLGSTASVHRMSRRKFSQPAECRCAVTRPKVIREARTPLHSNRVSQPSSQTSSQ
jgi:hypothetical protein